MNRVAVVTGASQGLGLALAAGLAERLAPGDVVYLTGRSPASRAWYDMTGAQTPAQAAGPLLDLVLGPAPAAGLYGELIRFGQRLPWSAAEPAATAPRGRPAR